MARWTRRGLFGLLGAVAVAGLAVDFGLATMLTSTTVTQKASIFSVSNGGVAAFPTPPAVTASSTPTGVSVCSASAVSLTSASTAKLYLGASKSVTCTTGHYALKFSYTSALNAAAGTYSFTAYATYGSGPITGSGEGNVTIASALLLAGTVLVYVDFGGSTPPIGGISSLSLIVA